ncbi:MAG: hypothetical protein ACT4NL_12995, partial [Pseudomarimonas sp.]
MIRASTCLLLCLLPGLAPGYAARLPADAVGNHTDELHGNGRMIGHRVDRLVRPPTTHTYNAANERVTTTRPDQIVERSSYFAWGDVASSTDADGITTTFAYDLRRRLITETRPHRSSDTAITRHDYDGHGNRIATTRPL